MELIDENDGFQHGRQLSINTGTISVSVISTYENETLDVIIEKCMAIIKQIKRDNE